LPLTETLEQVVPRCRWKVFPPYLRHQSPKVRRASSSLICSCSARSLDLVSRSASWRNLLQGNKLRPDYTGVPSVVFTVPPLAAVGLHEDDVKNAGQQFRMKYQDTSSWYASRRIGETCSGFK